MNTEQDFAGSSNRSGTVKVSVLLPEPVHRKLKLASVERRISIQKVMEVAAQEWIDGPPSESEPDPLALSFSTEPNAKEVRQWLAKCKRILESGNKLAILGCKATLEAMDALVEQAQREDSHGGRAFAPASTTDVNSHSG